LADKHLPKEVALGFKPVDHLQMAMSLTLNFLVLPIAGRQLYLEASLMGFGKGGFLQTDKLARFINHDLPEDRYRLENIPAIIMRYIAPLTEQYCWGYGISSLM